MSGTTKATSLKKDKEITKFINQLNKITIGVDTTDFAKEFASQINSMKKSEEVYYILDISTMCYIFLNQPFSFLVGYEAALIIKDKWIYIKELALQEDRLGLCVALKQSYKLISELPLDERKKAIVNISYRMQHSNKEIIKVLQKTKIISLDRNGAPALELGRITNITDFKHDNKVSGTFEINNTKIVINPSELLPQLKNYTALQLKHAQYVAEGKSVYEIMALTGKSESNVEHHLKRFRENANARTLEEAISKGKDQGVIK